MRKKLIIGSTIAAAMVIALTASVASAGYPEDKRVFFTFSGPVAVPGTTLPAGTYLFRLAAPISSGNRHLIQVLSNNGRTSHAMFFGISAHRPDYAPKAELGFMESAAGMPAAVKTWWYPGEKDGYEFIYPREQARLLATGTGESVLTERAGRPDDVERVAPATTDVGAGLDTKAEASAAPVEAESRVRADADAPAEAPAEPSQVAPENAAPVTSAPEPAREARTELPQTASNTGLLAFGAVGFALAAAAVRRARVARG